MDFYFGDEMGQYESEGTLSLFSVAFSRDQSSKVYVQHQIEKNKEIVWDVLRLPNTHVFVCGSSLRMPQDVRNAFLSVCIQQGGLSEQDAENYIRKLEMSGRYTTETWS